MTMRWGATHAERPHAVLGVGCIMGGRPMYFDCANEAGLAVAGLNFPRCGAFPHEAAEGMCNVATFEFPLWAATICRCARCTKKMRQHPYGFRRIRLKRS